MHLQALYTSEILEGVHVWRVKKVTTCRILNAKYTQHANAKGHCCNVCTHSLHLVWYMFTSCYNNCVIYRISQFN